MSVCKVHRPDDLFICIIAGEDAHGNVCQACTLSRSNRVSLQKRSAQHNLLFNPHRIVCMQEAIAAHSTVVSKGTCDVHRQAPLHFAASLGNVEAMEALLESGAPINATDGHGLSPLEVCWLLCA